MPWSGYNEKKSVNSTAKVEQNLKLQEKRKELREDIEARNVLLATLSERLWRLQFLCSEGYDGVKHLSARLAWHE